MATPLDLRHHHRVRGDDSDRSSSEEPSGGSSSDELQDEEDLPGAIERHVSIPVLRYTRMMTE